jgi:exopolysaccharide biosynthesis polyprenyl glycosylphosphotransferase
MLFMAFLLAYHVRFTLNLQIFHLEVRPPQLFYTSLMLLLVPLWAIIFAIVGLYDRQRLLGGTDEYARVLRATTSGMFIIIIAGFVSTEFIIARGWLISAWVFAFLFTTIGRFLLRRVVYTLRRKGYFLSMAVIVGANAEGQSLAEQLQKWVTSGLYVVGFIDNQAKASVPTSQGPPILGPLQKLDEIIRRHGIEELILTTSALSRDDILWIFQKYGVSSKVNLRLSSGLYEVITTGLQVKELAYVPLVGVNKVRLTGADRLLKLLIDYGLTLPGILLIAPLLPVIIIAIKLDSPGSVIHRRRVMGVNGIQFDAFKFRTMYENGEEILAQHPELQAELKCNHKLKDDPRVTPVGKIIRRYSLDELPQAFNVLRHEMSIVGPRMISPEEIKKYNQWGINLLTVRPGITGLWQVSGRSDIPYDKRVQLDMQYIRNWSVWLDIQILVRTIPAVLKGKGAY